MPYLTPDLIHINMRTQTVNEEEEFVVNFSQLKNSTDINV